MQYWSSSVRRVQLPNEETAIYDPSAKAEDKPPRLWARVKLDEAIDPGVLQKTLSRSSAIRAIWLRGSLKPSEVRSQLRGTFGLLASLVPSSAFQERRVEARITIREPTPNGLSRSVVQRLQDEWRKDRTSLDLGFEFDDGQKVWMSRPRPLKQTVPLSFRGSSEEQVDLRALLGTLQQRFRTQVARTIQG
jgi:hypothetical protein